MIIQSTFNITTKSYKPFKLLSYSYNFNRIALVHIF